jgi:TolA-binding protein
MIVVVGVASVGVAAAGTVAVRAVRSSSPPPMTASVSAPSRTPFAHASKHASSAHAPALPAEATNDETEDSPDLVPVASAAPVAPAAPVAGIAAGASVTPLVPAPPPVPIAPPAPVVSRAVVRAAAVSSPRPSAPTGSSAAAELAMLDPARAAIAQGDAARGLSLLDAYASKYPRGVMAPEASILRIEGLVKTGDHDGAKRVGDAFLRANPVSPYASRIESLLGTSNP